MHESLEDDELIRDVQAQKVWAFDMLFDRYKSMIQRHIAHIVQDEHAAEDLLQEVFLRVWMRAEQWNGQGSFKSWLYRIATNLALNHLRTLRRHPEQPLDVPENRPDEDGVDTPSWLVDSASLGPDAILELTEQHLWFRQMIQDLPEEKREVLHLVHQLEMSLREAADELGIPEGTVKSRLHYVRERLNRQRQDWQAEQDY